MYEDTGGKQPARLEAFSDGVFAIALTLLALDLKAPVVATVSNAHLMTALAGRWPEYVTFINSFVTVLLLWTSHHDIFKKVNRTDRRLTLANGLLLFFVSAVPYPTSVLGKYLLTDAASASSAFYAGYCVLIDAAFIVLWLSASAQNGQLLREPRRCSKEAARSGDASAYLCVSGDACLCQSVDFGGHHNRVMDLLGGHAQERKRSQGEAMKVSKRNSQSDFKTAIVRFQV